MKAGIVTAHARKTCWKTYKYHGIWFRCRVSCEPPPVITPPIHKPPPKWVLVYDVWPYAYQQWYTLYYDIKLFPASPDNSFCSRMWPDGKKHYWGYWMYFHRNLSGYRYFRNNGFGCQCSESTSSAHSMTFGPAHDLIWVGCNFLVRVYWPGKGTHLKIYASSDGRLPDYEPPAG